MDERVAKARNRFNENCMVQGKARERLASARYLVDDQLSISYYRDANSIAMTSPCFFGIRLLGQSLFNEWSDTKKPSITSCSPLMGVFWLVQAGISQREQHEKSVLN